MSETQSGPQVSGKLFLFERPELMTKEQHGELALSAPAKRYQFCANVRAIPITISEIPAAMKDYPIVFMSAEQPIPLAIMGLVDDVNLFVDDNGDWEENRYLPGYVRRYPFGIAAEASGERMAIVIDAAFEGLAAGGETPLFENEEPASNTQAAIEFCKTYERDRLMTDEFTKRLAPYELIHGQTAQYTPQGDTEPKAFAQYFGIDEEKLNALDDEQILELRKSGMLPILYAMMMSLGNWRMLLQRRAKRFGLTETQILNQAIN